jgi:hypothetical protein
VVLWNTRYTDTALAALRSSGTTTSPFSAAMPSPRGPAGSLRPLCDSATAADK